MKKLLIVILPFIMVPALALAEPPPPPHIKPLDVKDKDSKDGPKDEDIIDKLDKKASDQPKDDADAGEKSEKAEKTEKEVTVECKPEADWPGGLKMPCDKRIKMLLYDEADVYTITTRYGYQTNIVFAPQEEIETISVGDRSLWQIIPSGNRMFIRPMEEDVLTNMTVLTNKHSYQFDLKSVSPDKTVGNIYVAQFVYPDEKKKPNAMMAAAAAVPAPPAAAAQMAMMPPPAAPAMMPPAMPAAAPAAQPGPSVMPPVYRPPITSQAPMPGMMQPVFPNYSYTYAGPDELAPLQVYDDGKSTYLKYRDVNQPLPNVFVIGSNGKEMPVHFNVRGEYVVIDAVAGEMALKNSDGTVHIYNEMLNPG